MKGFDYNDVAATSNKGRGFLSEEELLQVIQFMNFLRYNKSQRVSVMVEQKKKI